MKLKPAYVVIAALGAILVLAVGVIGGRFLAASPEPGDTSADAGFARDMPRAGRWYGLMSAKWSTRKCWRL